MSFVLVPGQRGKNHLLHEGFRYSVKREINNEVIVWECCERRSRRCSCKCRTTKGANVVVSGSHNHSPSVESNEVFRLNHELKLRARNSNDRPANIIAGLLHDIDESIIPRVPLPRTVARRVRRERQKIGENEPLPRCLEDVQVPGKYRVTSNGEPFLLHDGGRGADRILLFTTESDLDMLAENQDWYVDGTFKTTPAPFMQLYTVHGCRLHASLPSVYALLPNKNEGSYRQLATALKTLRQDLAPRSIMFDFEQAALRGLADEFPQAEIRGCYFHFQQCLWRKLQTLNTLSHRYRYSASFALVMRHTAALAFVPVDSVRDYYQELKQQEVFQENGQMEEFTRYFEETWIGTRGRRGQWREARFPVNMWNTYQAVIHDQHRTNNNVEGWHTRFQSLVGSHHPNLWKFIEILQLEQNMTRVARVQFLAGRMPPPSHKKYQLIDARIKHIVNDFGNRSAMDYLRDVAFNLRFI